MPDSSGNPVPGDPGYVAPPPATGLVNTTPPAVPPAAPATPSTPTAVPFTVAPEATVASNVKGLIDADSPLMQQAATRAAGQMNARGLLNSSQAVGAGQAALYDAALPIAQADAATYARAGEQTTLAKNAAESQRANIETSTSQFNANASNTQQLQQNEAHVRLVLQDLQNNTQLTAIDKQTTAQKVIAEADNTARAAIARLQADTSLSATDKQIAANNILSLRDNETKVAMQTFQLGADLQKINADGTIRQSLADTEASYKILMQTSAGAADLYKQSLSNFAAIIANPDITDKTTALNNGVKQLNDGLKLIGDVANLDLGSYLNFEGVGGAAAPTPPAAPASSLPYGGDTNSGGGAP